MVTAVEIVSCGWIVDKKWMLRQWVLLDDQVQDVWDRSQRWLQGFGPEQPQSGITEKEESVWTGEAQKFNLANDTFKNFTDTQMASQKCSWINYTGVQKKKLGWW